MLLISTLSMNIKTLAANHKDSIMPDDDVRLFFELLQIAIGARSCLSSMPPCTDWERIYRLSANHAVIGIAFRGVERLTEECGEEYKPPVGLIAKWYSVTEKIHERNRLMDRRCALAVRNFSAAGFRSCILKGQGNALLYNEDLRGLRQPGDIDIWVEGSAGRIVRYVLSVCGDKKLEASYHHVDFPVWSDVAVEVHYRPAWLSSPLRNWRLQHWAKEQADAQFSNFTTLSEGVTIPVPIPAFNAVYQLTHIYTHLLYEGVGLRQLLDFYFVLISGHDSIKSKDVMIAIRRLGMRRLAGAVMYALQTVFAMPDVYLICEPDAREGRFLLNEIMQAGNFGQHDARFRRLTKATGTMRRWYQLYRTLHFIRSYPEAVLCLPFRLYHVAYRKLRLWRLH